MMFTSMVSEEEHKLPPGLCGSKLLLVVLAGLVLVYGGILGIAIWLASAPATPQSPCDSGLGCTSLPSMLIEGSNMSPVSLTVNGSLTQAGQWVYFRLRASASFVDPHEVASPRTAILASSVMPLDNRTVDSVCSVLALNQQNALPMHCAAEGRQTTQSLCGSDNFLVGVAGMSSQYPLPFQLSLTLTMTKDDERAGSCTPRNSHVWMWIFVGFLIAGELVLIPLFGISAYMFYRKRTRYEVLGEMYNEVTPLITK